jgi:putative DNA methylase
MSTESIVEVTAGGTALPGVCAHLLTLRLEGTLAPEQLRELREWREEQLQLTPPEPLLAQRYRQRIAQRFFAEYDRLLNENRRVESLAHCRVAAMLRRELLRPRAGYHLLAYAILPGHLHLVVSPSPDAASPASQPAHAAREVPVPLRMDEGPDAASPLVDYLRRLKEDTQSAAQALSEIGGVLRWAAASFDYWIGSPAELTGVVEYVADDPVAAGLVRSREQWFFSSAHERFLWDGTLAGWLPGTESRSREASGQ